MRFSEASSLIAALLVASCGGGSSGSSATTDASSSDTSNDSSSDATSDAATDVPSDDAPSHGTTVSTDKGPVSGAATPDGAIDVFLGIPYAAAPTGALRWKPPAAVAPWTTTRSATAIGPACPQSANALTGAAPPNAEDCLYLNVWTPATAKNAPVMVFIHGGSFVFGQGGDALYDGTNLAREGVVVVTINYRLGALGFMAHPSLSAESDQHGSSGNYGLLDQLAALAWVQRNVAAFGGDPSAVTVFGESAGAISVGAHLVSPLAKGLFARALGESGTVAFLTTPLKDPGTPTVEDSAEEHGVSFSAALGCAGATAIDCMRALPVATILGGQGSGLEISSKVSFVPNIDGYVLPDSPLKLVLAGSAFAAPYLLGTNADEGTLFDSTVTITNDAQYRAALSAVVAPNQVDPVLAIYPSASFASPKDAYDHFVGEALFVCPSRVVAAASASHAKQTFLYHYTHVDAVGQALGWGSFHASELPLVFGNFSGVFAPATAIETALSKSMIGYWTRFAKTGDPNDPSGAAVTWPAYTAAADQYLELGDTISVKANLVKDRCDALAKIGL